MPDPSSPSEAPPTEAILPNGSPLNQNIPPDAASLTTEVARLRLENHNLRGLLQSVTRAIQGQAPSGAFADNPLVKAVWGMVEALSTGEDPNAAGAGVQTLPCPVCKNNAEIRAGVRRATGQACVCGDLGVVAVRG